MAKASEAQLIANQRWARKNYDTIALNVPKGNKEKLKDLAAAEGESLNRYILKALEQRSGLKLTLDGEQVGGGPKK